MRARIAFTLALLLSAFVVPAGAYLPIGVEIGGEVIALRWGRSPVHWRVSDHPVPNVSTAAFQSATVSCASCSTVMTSC